MLTLTRPADRTEPEFCDSLITEDSVGIVAGTKVATAQGWRKVEALQEGDRVLTFDGGLQPVISIRRQIVWAKEDNAPVECWPLAIPVGAMGNREVMALLPNQAVMIESDAAEEVFGDPFALIPAAALRGFRGITPMLPPVRIEVVNLFFAEDQIVFANVGAMFHCPRARDLFSDGGTEPEYEVLSFELARHLIGILEIEDETKRRPSVPQTRATAVA